MPSFLKKLARHAGVYAVGNVLSSAASFLLIPLYTRSLSQADYGLFETLNIALLLLGMVSTIGFASSVLKSHELDVQDVKERSVLFGTALLSVLTAVLLITIPIFLFRAHIATWLLDGVSSAPLIVVALGANALLSVAQIGLAFLRAQERSAAYALLSVLRGVALLAASALYLFAFRAGVLGAVAAYGTAAFLLCFFLFPLLVRHVRLSFSPLLFYRLASFGVAILPAQAAMWFMDLSDRFFLKASFGFGEVGAYSLSYKLAGTLSVLLITPFQLAWPTASFSAARRSEAEAREACARTLLLFASLGALLVGGLSLYARPLVQLIGGTAYLAGAAIIPVVASGYVVYGMHFILTTGIHLAKRSRQYPLFVIVPALLNVGLNAIFIPRYGMVAAAWTTFVSFFLVSILTFFFTQRVFPIRYPWGKILTAALLLFFTLGMGLFLLNGLEPDQWAAWLLPLPLVGALGYGLLKLNGLPVRSLLPRLRSLLSPAL